MAAQWPILFHLWVPGGQHVAGEQSWGEDLWASEEEQLLPLCPPLSTKALVTGHQQAGHNWTVLHPSSPFSLPISILSFQSTPTVIHPAGGGLFPPEDLWWCNSSSSWSASISHGSDYLTGEGRCQECRPDITYHTKVRLFLLFLSLSVLTWPFFTHLVAQMLKEEPHLNGELISKVRDWEYQCKCV